MSITHQLLFYAVNDILLINEKRPPRRSDSETILCFASHFLVNVYARKIRIIPIFLFRMSNLSGP